jgi:heptosyltransferase-2
MVTLIIAPHALADAVRSQPLVSLLSRLGPGGRIHVVAHPDVVAVYESMPEIETVWPCSQLADQRNWLGLALLARRLRRIGFQRTYLLSESSRARALTWMAGLTVNGSGQEHIEQQAFNSARTVQVMPPRPTLARSIERESSARSEAGLPPDGALLVLCLDDEDHQSRRWASRHWAALIAQATRRFPELTPVMIGRASTRTMATEALALCGRSKHNLCGQLTSAQTLAIVSQSQAVVSLDNSVAELAAAFGRPLVALFGPSDPRRTPLQGPRTRIEWMQLACSPCHQPTCPLGHGHCMTQLHPERLARSLETVLARATRDIR